mmetsp:Transcript_8539/g.24324  ORF Transcript_8539/g.24324 Transcript_8539/m.24324 type:complete len:218 (-) Transcript_8539:344-997(-)
MSAWAARSATRGRPRSSLVRAWNVRRAKRRDNVNALQRRCSAGGGEGGVPVLGVEACRKAGTRNWISCSRCYTPSELAASPSTHQWRPWPSFFDNSSPSTVSTTSQEAVTGCIACALSCSRVPRLAAKNKAGHSTASTSYKRLRKNLADGHLSRGVFLASYSATCSVVWRQSRPPPLPPPLGTKCCPQTESGRSLATCFPPALSCWRLGRIQSCSGN